MKKSFRTKEEWESCSCCHEQSLYVTQLTNKAANSSVDADTSFAPPEWHDPDLFRVGQRFAQHNFFSVFINSLGGLLCILAIKSILIVLVMTGKSGTMATAYKRYLSTVVHVRSWLYDNIWDSTSKAHTSLKMVRRFHQAAFTTARQKEVGIPSQYDLVVTQWGFVGLLLVKTHSLGIHESCRDLEGFIQMWKTLGFLMGIEDRFNICNGSLEECRAKCQAVLHRIIIPALLDPPEDYPAMCQAMLEGSHLILPVVDPLAFKANVYDLVGLPTDLKAMPVWSRSLFFIQVYLLSQMFHVPVLEAVLKPIFNCLLETAILICNAVPSIAFYCNTLEVFSCKVLNRVFSILSKWFWGIIFCVCTLILLLIFLFSLDLCDAHSNM